MNNKTIKEKKTVFLSWAWWFMPVIPALEKLR
jgi:hypothetical protein